MTELLHIESLTVRRDGERPVLQDLDLTVDEGQHTLLLGPSGCGKTSLIYVIAQLLRFESGSVRFTGRPLTDWGDPRAFRLRHLGLVFQEVHLLDPLSVRHNLEMVRNLSGDSSAPSPEDLLRPLGMIEHIDTRASRLSRGERQRVAIARAFANGPRLLLADEPTASLDPSNRDRSLEHIFSLADRFGTTAIVASHDVALQDHAAFKQILVIHEGRLTEGAASR